MSWYKKFGFSENPLDIRPNSKLVGLIREEEKLINHILKGEICFLNGLTGSGKTSLLKKVQEKLNGNFIYLDAHDLPENFNLEEEIIGKRSFFDRITFKELPSNKPILIIDEFQATDLRIVLEARSKWENPNKQIIKSVVIAQISPFLKNVSSSFKERIGHRMITLRPLDEEELKEILKLRLIHSKGKYNLFKRLHKDTVDLIVKCAGDNPRRLLEYTDLIFDFHHTKFKDKNPMFNETYVVNFHGAKEILDYYNINTEGFDSEFSEKKGVNKAKKLPDLSNTYDNNQIKILKYLENTPKTIDQISSKLSLSESRTGELMVDLKKKGAILIAGKRERRLIWKINPNIKRRMVRV